MRLALVIDKMADSSLGLYTKAISISWLEADFSSTARQFWVTASDLSNLNGLDFLSNTMIPRVRLGMMTGAWKSLRVWLSFLINTSTSSWFRCVSRSPIMSWLLIAVSSFSNWSCGSCLANPRRLNEQIQKDDRMNTVHSVRTFPGHFLPKLLVNVLFYFTDPLTSMKIRLVDV